eukprot:TRINITY_DN39493_c0_g1_i1.p2 TRINITY_DN39493_c0_g1~~TRINITY_DN39493_c0_g1_i1.p2  ORF type:complete len:629 (+),score=238.80 TRINITY_DN39493_c0_g1_i1:80-1888(+)
MPTTKAVVALATVWTVAGFSLPPLYFAAVVGATVLLAVWISQCEPVEDLTPDRPGRALLHDKFSESKLPDRIDAIVIGGGMGGLTTAAVMARAGKRVVVLEQHPDVVGGGTHEFNLEGYRFDSGLHYTVPWSGPLFQLACLKTPSEVPQFELMGTKDGTFDRVAIGDAPLFDMKHGEAHNAKLREMFPDEQAGIDEFMRVSGGSMNGVKYFVLSKLLPAWLQPLYWRLLPRSVTTEQQQTAETLLTKLIKSPRLRSLLCSLWIDTGARPDRASMLLTGAVQRGLPKEGGCYPRGGSETLAAALVPVIEKWGGRVLIDARVGEILCDDASGRVTGVRMVDGTEIEAPVVVSSAGYHNTFGNLVSAKITSRFGVPRKLPVKQTPGFLMANIGIKGRPADLGITNTNLWYHPADEKGDIFPAMRNFFSDPIKYEPPTMITFGSSKDQSYHQKNPDKVCCQMLVMAEFDWFKDWAEEQHQARGRDYDELKKKWEEKLLAILHRFYPLTKGKVEMCDISTPLTIAHWLSAKDGAAVGLDITAERFYDYDNVQRHLNAATPIPGLYQTGHDIVMPGVVMAQLAGVITGWKAIGFAAAARQLLQSIFLV